MNKNNVCLFVRVSSELKQDYDRQIHELTLYAKEKGYKVVKTIATKVSGRKDLADRKDLELLYAEANKRSFAKLLVCEVSRIGRTNKSIRTTLDHLHSLGISVVFKNLGGLESLDENGQETFVSNIIISIYSELAAEEARWVSIRTKSALKRLKDRGVILGRPEGTGMDKKALLKKYYKLSKDIKSGLSLQKCMVVHEVSKNTVLKVKKALTH